MTHPTPTYATLDGWIDVLECPIECKHDGGREPLEVIVERYQPQMQWQMECTGADQCALSVIMGASEPVVQERSRLNRGFSFDSFVTGKANQLARAAAIQVAENPGISYNPLFVYGGVGLGKTHLVQAIGNQLADRNPQARMIAWAM